MGSDVYNTLFLRRSVHLSNISAWSNGKESFIFPFSIFDHFIESEPFPAFNSILSQGISAK